MNMLSHVNLSQRKDNLTTSGSSSAKSFYSKLEDEGWSTKKEA